MNRIFVCVASLNRKKNRFICTAGGYWFQLFANMNEDFYESSFMKLPSKWQQVIEHNGAYLMGYSNNAKKNFQFNVKNNGFICTGFFISCDDLCFNFIQHFLCGYIRSI